MMTNVILTAPVSAIKQNLIDEITQSRDNNPTTKPLEANRTAFKPCFFYALNIWIAVSNGLSKGMKNRNRILNAGGLIGLNTRPFNGNKSSRLVAVVETRPPVKSAGGQTLTKPLGGLSMAINSLSITLMNQSWFIRIRKHTDKQARLYRHNGTPMAFEDAGKAFDFAVSLKSQGGRKS